ncbi:MAG TPA: carboxypeptidase-like regulatory domain-containing protein [Bryobacteraceae bacterium]|nr:carboxypeptidase-like regulatory domain-containing protein [Bryobacteraceae bacterium]
MRVLATILITLLLTGVAQAQTLANSPSSKGSVEGHVLDADTGAPVPNVPVSVEGSSESVKTDTAGRFTVPGLSPGMHSVRVLSQFLGSFLATGEVNVESGSQPAEIDFRVRMDGSISGRVLDENKEPLKGLTVFLIGREYVGGVLRYSTDGRARTNDRGEYHVDHVRPRHAYLVLAESGKQSTGAISDGDPAHRKPVLVPTYFPNSTSIAGAIPVALLSSAEHRDGVDILVSSSPSYCVEAMLTADGRPAALSFDIQNTQDFSKFRPAGVGSSSDATSDAMSGPDGRIRVCGLPSGEFQLVAFRRPEHRREPLPYLGITSVTITDDDVRGIRLTASRPVTITGEVKWSDSSSDNTPPGELYVNILRLSLPSPLGPSKSVKVSVPGQFSVAGLPEGDYSLRVGVRAANAYVKDVLYGGLSVLHKPLQIQGEGGGTLSVVVGRDGGSIQARTADSDGKIVPFTWVAILPSSAGSQAILGDAMIYGQSDQNGSFRSLPLAPGKYRVIAATEEMSRTPEVVDKIWERRITTEEVEVSPRAVTHVDLEPKTIDWAAQ